jgi:hypothetical protein
MTSAEPPTVIETVVKAAIKAAAVVPVVGPGLSAAAQVVYDDVRARRAAVAVETMSAIVGASGGETLLGARLAADPQLETTFVTAVDAAIRTGHEQKRRLLARAVDEAQLMVDTLSQLDVPHIHTLQRLANERERYQPATDEQYEMLTEEHFRPPVAWANALAPVKATLVRVGAVQLMLPEESEGPLTGVITQYGMQILQELRAEPEGSQGRADAIRP